jgi:DnaK suppressor protein
MAKRIENIREYLEKERERLTQSLAAIAGQSIIDERHEATSFGREDEKVAQSLEIERRLVLTLRTRERLAEIQLALEKLMNGTYGLCDGCGGLIAPERLEVLPQTSFCLLCKVKQSNSPSRVGVV